jgi:imidazolonepropionase-like amidohydrolase
MVHANGELPVRIAVEAGCDSIEHGFFMGRDNLERMARQGTIWVPTAVTMLAYAESAGNLTSHQRAVCRRNLEHQLDQLHLARELGVSVAVGTDAGSLGVHHGGALRRELGLLMQAGYPVEEAVRCASANGARLLRLPGGRIEIGAAATMVAVQGSPADLPASLARIECVLCQGRIAGGRRAASGS